MILKDYTILAIDTSCDETSAAVTVNDRVFSNVVSSQVELHKKYGGVVPIIAQRAHKKRIDAVISEALKRATTIPKSTIKLNDRYKKLTLNFESLDAFAVTVGPGLAPALEVGIAKAKELAAEYEKPLIAVNHMEGHLLSPFAKNSKGRGGAFFDRGRTFSPSYPQAKLGEEGPTSKIFPLMALLVSGGHTQLVLMDGFGDYKLLGETLDDACGEAFDKVAKILELGYPGGPIVDRLAKKGEENAYDLPVPMIERKDLNFSFSGLKTAVLYLVKGLKKKHGSLTRKTIAGLCASFQRVVVEHLVNKLMMAVEKYQPKGVLLGGGVISNLYLRRKIRGAIRKQGLLVFVPYDKRLFTDNAAMIGVCAYYKAKRGEFVSDLEKLDRNPGLGF